MNSFAMTIDGSSVPAEDTFDVINPADETLVEAAPRCTPAQLDAAFDAAQRAFRGWRHDEAARRDVLKRGGDTLNDAAEELAAILTAEQGKPLRNAAAEIRAAAHWFKYYAELERPEEPVQLGRRAQVETVRRPLGVVAAITPWNYPILLAAWKIAPALLAGNTLVVKPSPYTPLSTLKMGELLAAVAPPGVVNVVSGGDELGVWMTAHAVPRKISFTGSIATGKAVAAAAASDLKRVTLELGGNDPAIVLDDADPSAIADALFASAFENSGQVCSAIKRVYVPERLAGALAEALADRATSVKVGNGVEEGVRLGPINNEAQLERVSELVADALKRGGTAVAGGARLDGPGYFYAPTILTDVSDGMPIVDDEQFGPALPIVVYRDVDDALRRANATNYGLSASVWGADPERATEVARGIESGTVWINTHLALAPQQPFGGMKWSGVGVENGLWGLNEFTDLQVLHRAIPQEAAT